MNIKELQGVASLLVQNQIAYTLGGSGLLASLGLIEQVNDWDLLVDCSLEKLKAVLEPYPYSEQKSGDYPFASQFRLQLIEQNIDIIGNFALHSSSGTVTFPLTASSTWHGIHVGAPEIWFVAYKLMGRDAKAELLFNYLLRNEINESAVKRFIEEEPIDDSIKSVLFQLMNAHGKK
ncbi:hypothetical protein GCM10008018_56150 [Paenibacillus marchantiophytorum]|uniref:Nucleotidyltransferase family protein n=1 Tax=Paenibacillus marchantiophytorum TaxID=1619310 RepID=A0ABQ1F7V9_9BACL|nr:hypothetical protein [Paenibacillus marchantiophytorum]GGA02852.1 hypothetical protein GCM10008018_56150 [Paenibacillus marchantiophytorum]